MKRKTIVILISIILLIVIYGIFLPYKTQFRRVWIELFNLDTVIYGQNSKGEWEGKVEVYKKGQLFIVEYYHNGKREGVETEYYPTGQVSSKVLFLNNKKQGIDTGYYQNGVLEYLTPYKDDKYFGSGYHYSVDGKLTNYNGLGFDEGFCLVKYNDSGNITQILGWVMGDNIISKDRKSGDTIKLKNDSLYCCISDLYIAVATPPKLRTNLKLIVNNASFFDSIISSNMVVIRNVFKNSGTYHLKIIGQFLDLKNQVMKSDTSSKMISIK